MNVNAKELSLRDVLRYFVSGGIYLLTLFLLEDFRPERAGALHPPNDLAKNEQKQQQTDGTNLSPIAPPDNTDWLGRATASVGLALVIGTLIYSAYRAVLFPLLFWGLRHGMKPRGLTYTPFPSVRCALSGSDELAWDYARTKDRLETESYTAQLEEWANQIHLLYTSSLAIVLGLLTGAVIFGDITCCGTEFHWLAFWLFMLAVLLWFAGVVAQRRYLVNEYFLLFVEKRSSDLRTPKHN